MDGVTNRDYRADTKITLRFVIGDETHCVAMD